jgi:uncharacterized metal-binding protein YceD (DUF177 family)
LSAPFSRTVELAAIPATGLERSISADSAELAALAGAYGIPEVRKLAADLTLTRESGGVIRVNGRVAADIVQTCVVSLVPVEQTIDEPIDVRLVEAASPRAEAAARPGAEVMINPDDPDPPDILSGPMLDLGVVATEHFLLAVDPYPRAPGAELPADAAESSPDASDSPFAALARLRGGTGGNTEKTGR